MEKQNQLNKTEPGKSPPEKISSQLLSAKCLINFLIVLTCTAICLVQSGQCLSRFLDYDTKTIMSVLPTGEATFPALTICPRPEEAYNATVLEQLGITADDYRNGYFYGNVTDAYLKDGFDIFNLVTFKLPQIMDYLKIKTADTKNDSIRLYFNQPLNDGAVTWSTLYDVDYGKCYSMKISSEVTEKSILNLILISKLGIHLYLHHPGQYWHWDTNKRMLGQAGEMLFIDLTHELTVNTLENNGDNSCSSKVDNTYDDCVMNGLSQALVSEFGCVVPFVPPYNGTEFCRFDTTTEEGLAMQNKLINRYNFLVSSGRSTLCSKPCSSMDIYSGLPVSGEYEKEETYIKLYTKSSVKVKKTVWDYPWVSMLAEIGGYTGLLLGISVINITDSLDWIRFRLFII